MGKQQPGATTSCPDDAVKTGIMPLLKNTTKACDFEASFYSSLDDQEVSIKVSIFVHEL